MIRLKGLSVLGRILGLTVAALSTGAAAQAQEWEASRPGVPPSFVADMRDAIVNEVTFITLESQNRRNAGLERRDIAALDRQWAEQRGAPDQPLIARVLSNPLSTYLTMLQARSAGLYVEIFVTDRYGLNAGQSSVTSDYWQGDEDKWLRTFAAGPRAVHYGDIETRDGLQIATQQVSFTIVHPETGEPIGAATVEVSLTEMERRS